MLSRYYSYCFSLAVFALVSFYGDSYADDELQFPGEQKKWLVEHGIGMEFEDTFDIFSNTTGGKRQGVRPLNVAAISAQIDGNKAFGAQGVTATFSVIESGLKAPSRSLVGSVQRIDNMETTSNGFDVYLAWVQKTWLDERISLLAGIYDLSDEFFTTDSSDFFINSTFGFGPEISEIGKHNNPAVFPTSAPSVRLKVLPAQEWYLEAALSDGINSDPVNHAHSLPHLDSNSSALVMTEAGYKKELQGAGLDKLAIGGWRYVSEIHNFLNEPTTTIPLQNGIAQGVYALGEYKLYSFSAQRFVSGFLRIDVTDPEVNDYSKTWSAGVLWNGVVQSREHSQLGLAFSNAENTRNYQRSAALIGLDADPGEMVTEISYKDEILPWLSVQPDAQYIINPGALGRHEDAVVIGARLEAKF